VGEPLPHVDLEHLLQPRLRHDQDQQGAHDQTEDQKLASEGRQVALFERVEEAALPDVEPDLAHRIGADDNDDSGGEQSKPVAIPRRAERGKQRGQLGD